MGRLTTQEDFAPGCTLSSWALQSQLHPHRHSFLNMASLSSFQVFTQALPFPWNVLYLFLGGVGGGEVVSCSTWDLSSLTSFKPVPPALEIWRPNHWTAREPLPCNALVTLFPFSHHLLPLFFSWAPTQKSHRMQEALWVEPGGPSLGTSSDGTLCSTMTICFRLFFSLDHQILEGKWSMRHLQAQLKGRHTKGIFRPTQLPKET